MIFEIFFEFLVSYNYPAIFEVVKLTKILIVLFPKSYLCPDYFHQPKKNCINCIDYGNLFI
jgi:hypothetical protein